MRALPSFQFARPTSPLGPCEGLAGVSLQRRASSAIFSDLSVVRLRSSPKLTTVLHARAFGKCLQAPIARFPGVDHSLHVARALLSAPFAEASL